MSIFWKMYDRMTGVIGNDCDGKPLRAGDEVVILSQPKVKPEYRGLTVKVVGRMDDGDVEIDIPGRSGRGNVSGPGHCLRRIDHPDSASWDEVSKATGWTPKIEAPARTEEVGL